MKKRYVIQHPNTSPKYVVAHGLMQHKKGRNPSVAFGDIRNPRKAFSKAAQILGGIDPILLRQAPSNDEVTCRSCKRKYTSSFFDDFYPDDQKNPTVGLCERCFMAEVFAPKHIASELHINIVCKMSQPGACMFLVFDGKPKCAKRSSMHKHITSRATAGEMRATGDNCSGPPDFKPIAPQPQS